MRGILGGVPSAVDRSASPPDRRPAGAAETRTLPEDTPILRFRLTAIFAAQMFDFVTFTIMVERHGVQAELNPIVAASFLTGGLPILFFVKLALVMLVGATIVILGRRESPIEVPSKLASLITVAAVIGGVFGGWTNALTI
jgi:hypothetical protein